MLTLDTQKQADWRKATVRENSVALRHKALLQEIESNTVSVADDNGNNVADLMSRIGRPMTAQELMHRLKLINPRLIFERSNMYHNLYGIYVMQPERTPAGTWVTKKVHVCGMEAGIMPELSVRHKRQKEVPNPDAFGNTEPTRDLNWNKIDTFDRETRGWRCVLARLLHARLITRLDIEKSFGWTPSVESESWYRATT